MLPWLPKPPDNFRQRVQEMDTVALLSRRLAGLEALATHNLNPAQAALLSAVIMRTIMQVLPRDSAALGYCVVPLLILTECTVSHFIPPLVVSGIRRQMLFTITVGEYGQLHQALISPQPTATPPRFVIFVLDVNQRLGSASLSGSAKDTERCIHTQMAEIDHLAKLVVEQFGATPVFHSVTPFSGRLFGNHEAVIGVGPVAAGNLLNRTMVEHAQKGTFLLWDLNALADDIGRDRLFDIRLWRHAKMPISPDAGSLAMDQLAALTGAALGRSRKVLVLDLDNTIWGGIIGDDGLDGIVLGQGSGEGEAFLAFQHYIKALRSRGVLIAVSSKNNHDVCEAVFRQHPEMVLTMDDFACFKANWSNKADNLVEISRSLNLGLDAFVFFDDSPVERELIRQELPMVAVPEVPDDPAFYVDCLARAHYFDAISLSVEDVNRQQQYLGNEKRRAVMEEARDLSSFLHSLDMKIIVRGFSDLDLVRIAQLVNKTNQFNLTTRRYTEAEVRSLRENLHNVLLTARVEDRYGDNGLISVVIAKPSMCGRGLFIDTWLMSCRVLGRNVEQSLMKTLVQIAKRRGAEFLLGCYSPTAKNKMVETFYAEQGFGAYSYSDPLMPNATWWRLDLEKYAEPQVFGTLEVRCDA